MAYTTIDNPELYFQAKLYTGNFTDNTAITLDGSEDMQPDLVVLKERAEGEGYRWHDSVRGATKYIMSSSANGEATNADTLKSFNSDGFTLGANNEHNQDSMTYVAWCWKESATAGFDIVTYTGNGTGGNTVSHSLGVKPNLIFTKKRSANAMWGVYESRSGADYYMNLDDIIGAGDNATIWNDTEPTTSVFSLGTHAYTNTNTATYVGYLWRSVQGFSKIAGSYVGNGNADGPIIFTSFRPSYVICKNISGNGNWGAKTAKSQAYNGADVTLFLNSTSAESAFSDNKVDLLSNGFKIRTASSDFNTSGSNYIYMAFAEQPFVNSNGVPCNAR